MVYTGSKLIAITKVYGEIYFIISVIRTKTIAVQIIDNINRYIKSLDSILNKKTSECPNRRMYAATSIDPLNISSVHNFVEEIL